MQLEKGGETVTTTIATTDSPTDMTTTAATIGKFVAGPTEKVEDNNLRNHGAPDDKVDCTSVLAANHGGQEPVDICINLELKYYHFVLHEEDLFGRLEDMEVMDVSDDECDTLVYSDTRVHGPSELLLCNMHAQSDEEFEMQPNEHNKVGVGALALSNSAVIEAKPSGISFVLDPASCIH